MPRDLGCTAAARMRQCIDVEAVRNEHPFAASELRRRTAAGQYQTVAACYDTENTDAAKVPDFYRQKDTVKDCTIYWDWGHK